MINKQILNDNWHFRYKGQWKASKVPGSIHLDLLSNDEIKNPFIGTNEEDLRWISARDWDYKLTFKVEKKIFEQKNIFILFEGVDTYSEIFLNDQKILSTNNMFHPWTSDVKHILRTDTNELLVKFRSPINEVIPKMQGLGYELPADNDQAGKTSPHTRKAPYHYGWDWGPSLVTSGLWKNVMLVGYKEFNLQELNISNISCDQNLAKLKVELSILSEINTPATITLSEEKHQLNRTFNFSLKKGQNYFQEEISIERPDLWWPVGHGKQPLYSFNIEVSSEKTKIKKSKKIGIRKVHIKREQDTKGMSFEIYVNDVPIFSKGANWIPADSFTTRLDKNDYEKLIIAARDANMNTLRIWGGGIYEPDVFYELCDKYGIMVWQDFMFACSMYPADEDFLLSVEEEIRFQVSRLKSYSCIILWCGNNEIASGWLSWGWKEELPSKVYDDYEILFHQLLPDLCIELDPHRLYWPSSPGHDLQLPKEDQIYGSGDNHYWGVWHSGEPFEAFEENVGRFMSEYGMQSFPNNKTIDSFAKEKDKKIDSEVMNFHQKASLGTSNLIMYIEKYYSIAKSFEKVVVLSQIMQAEAIKSAVEAHRRNMPFCMGTLYWQFNDCWPGISWSSIDYSGSWKAFHFVARHFYKPILTCIKKTDSNIEVSIINDLNKSFIVELNIFISSFNGEVFFEKRMEGIKVNPTSSTIYYDFEISPNGIFDSINLNETVFHCEVVLNNKIISKNELFFVKPKDLNLRKPEYELSYKENGEGFLITIQAKVFMYRLFLQAKNLSGTFSDNFFHLRKGDSKEIVFTSDKYNLNEKINEKTFTIQSLYDLQKQ